MGAEGVIAANDVERRPLLRTRLGDERDRRPERRDLGFGADRAELKARRQQGYERG